MTGLIVVLVLICVCVLAYRVWASVIPEASEPPPTEAELLQARLDLLKVDLAVSASLAKLEHRQAAERIKDSIAESFEDNRR